MATPTTTVSDYCLLLSKSKLLPAEEVESIHRRWKEESPGGDVEAFSKYLVHKRILTPWQSAMVQRGRADGFFLDRYKILDQIGKGQMGGVYKAVHSLGQMVALKILPASRAKDQRVLGRFQREARLLTQLDHPNVVRAFQVGDSGGRHFIVMEFLEGETLDEILGRRKRLSVGEAVRLIRQALDGLQHVHERRMVHRDLKPTNLMITPATGGKGSADNTWEATVKIVDIGLGRELFDESAPEGAIDTQLTVEGAVVGTPDYMAPEQAKDARTADIRADIYSLGCVLYRCITGRTPFPDANIMTQMLRHATENPPPMATIVDGIPTGLQEVLDRMCAKRPDDRFAQPAEGSEALKRFQTDGAGAEAAKADMNPAFRQWLETESQMIQPSALLPGPAPVAPTQTKPYSKPGSATTPPLQAGPKSPPVNPPKHGTAQVPVLPKGPGSGPHAVPTPLRPAPPQYPQPVPASPGWQPQPVTVPYPMPEEEVSVELVTLPSGGPQMQMPIPVQSPFEQQEPRVIRVPDTDRPLTDLNRRDLFLMGLGGLGVLLAVGAGYALTSLLKSSKPTPTEDSEKKD